MKKCFPQIVLFSVLLLSTITSYGQEVKTFTYEGEQITIPMVNQKIRFSRVFNCDSISAEQLYANAKIAIADMFVSAQSVIQLDDSDNKTIIVKGKAHWVRNSEALFTQGFDVAFTLKIECRDNRYRASMYDFSSKNSTAYKGMNLETVVEEDDAFRIGVKKTGEVRKDLYGLSIPAWNAITTDVFTELKERIEHNHIDMTEETW